MYSYCKPKSSELFVRFGSRERDKVAKAPTPQPDVPPQPKPKSHLTKSSEQISRQRGQLWSQSSQWRKSQCNGLRKMTTGSSRSPKLPLTLRFLSDVTKSGQSEAQQGLLSPLIIPSPLAVGIGTVETMRHQADDEAVGCLGRVTITAAEGSRGGGARH